VLWLTRRGGRAGGDRPSRGEDDRGDDGLVRRFHHEYGFSTEGTTAVVTTELFDFGIDVDVQAPPPDQVVTLNDVIRP
jgi:hypothetical protein